MSIPTGSPRAGRRPGDWAALLALVFCWGSSFVFVKIAVASISPVWSVPLRLIAALLVFLPVFWYAGERLPRDLRFWVWMTGVSLFGTMLPFFLIAWGTRFIDTGLAGVLIGTVPLFVMALAHLVLPDERATPAKLAGFVIGFVGLAVLIGPTSLGDLGGGTTVFLGQIAIVGAALCFALQNVGARVMPPAGAMQKTLANIVASLVMSLAVAIPTGLDGLLGATLPSLLAVLALGVTASAVAGVVMFWLIASAGPSFTSLTNYLIPTYTLLFGAAVFGEVIGVRTLAGLVLILAGIAISELWRGRRAW